MITVAQLAAPIIHITEGCKLIAYWDPTALRWTIGWGHTGPEVHKGSQITQHEADALFAADIAHLLAMVAGKPIFEAAALVSFGYNCGQGALARLLAGEISMPSYGRTSNGVPLPGLGARRDLEWAMIQASRQMAVAA